MSLFGLRNHMKWKNIEVLHGQLFYNAEESLRPLMRHEMLKVPN